MTNDTSPPTGTPHYASMETAPGQPSVRYATRGAMVEVLDRLGVSLAVAAQPNQLVLLGAADGALTASATFFSNPFGLAVDGDRLAIATRHAVSVFSSDPRLAAGHPGRPNHYDAFFVPRTIHITGDCHNHDIAFAGATIVVCNTAFSCICRLDGQYSFVPQWQPPFITALMPEDRCHLNGFAADRRGPAYATALGVSNEPRGWRAGVETGGVVIDTRRNAVLCDGLCLPHSPRLIGDRLFVLNGGEGEVLCIDRDTGARTVLARLPAFTHGLCHHGGVLFVGMSRDRLSRTGAPPPVVRREPKLYVGVAAIDARTGSLLGSVEFDGLNEVTDVQLLPGIRRPGVQSLVGQTSYDGIKTPQAVFWLPGVSLMAEAAATGNYPIKLDIKVT